MLRLVLALVALLSSAGATATLLSPGPHITEHTPTTTPARNETTIREYPMPPVTMACGAPPAPPLPRDERMVLTAQLDPRAPSFDARFPVVDARRLDHVLVDFALDGGGLPAGSVHAELLDGQGRILKENEGTSLAIDRAPAPGTFTARIASDAPVSQSVRATIVVHYADAPANGDRSDWVWWLRTPGPSASARGGLDVQGATPVDLKVGWVDAPPLADDRVSVIDAYGNPTRTQEWDSTLAAGGSGAFHLALGDEALELRDMGFSPPHAVEVFELAMPDPRPYAACWSGGAVALDG
jgi:hypothetical protein